MKKFLLVCLAAAPLLASCGPTDQQIGQTILFVAPAAFLSALALQYLLFRLWKRRRPALTFAWRPSLIFLGVLILVAAVLTKGDPAGFVAGPDTLIPYAFISFGPACLTVIFIVTRIWLWRNPPRAFTWAPIVAMLVFILPAFPMLASAEDRFGQLVAYCWWIPPGGWFPGFLGAQSGPGFPGWLTLLVFIVLLIQTIWNERWLAWLPWYREPPPAKG